MAKKRNPQLQNQPAPEKPEAQAQPVPAQPSQPPASPVEPSPVEPAAAPVSNTKIIVFWSAVGVAVALAWLLDYMLPGVSEHVIERWIMLGFALFLGGFLYTLK